MMTWLIDNIFTLVGFVLAFITGIWGLAVKFAKFEQKDEAQEYRLMKLEMEHKENHKLHLANETRLVKLESDVKSTKDIVVSVDKKLSDLQQFLMEKMS